MGASPNYVCSNRCKIGFASEAMSQTMIVTPGPVGLPQLEWTVLMMFMILPALIAPKLADKYTASARPFDLFMWGSAPRLLLYVLCAFMFKYSPLLAPAATDHNAPQHPLLEWLGLRPAFPVVFYVCLVALLVSTTMISQVMFAGAMGFITRISDPRLGGTYMTLFNTIANLGSKWTNTAFFSAVAFYADYARAEPSRTLESELVCTEWAGTALPRTCASVLTTKIAPMAKGANTDGFYPICALSIVLGVVWLIVASPVVSSLQNTPPNKFWAADSKRRT